MPALTGSGEGSREWRVLELRIRMVRLLVFLVCLLTHMIQAQNLIWHFRHPVKNTRILLGEKGTVQEKLIEIGELPDPFYGENENKFNWIEQYQWEFSSEIEITDQLKKEFVEIEFPSIDTYASIFINDSLVAQTENAFYTHRFQVKEYLKKGKNTIKVIFTPPILYNKEAYYKRSSKLPAPNDVGEIAVASMTRKPQYQFGWDWALRMNTIGFWKAAQLISYDDNRLVQAKIETKSLEASHADLVLELIFGVESHQEIRIKSELFGEISGKMVRGKFTHKLELKSPELWWPRGHGEAFLYKDKILIYNYKNELISSKELTFGVRTTELIQDKDQYGTSFYFKINGKAIFCKGANFIPQDVFPARITDRSTENILEQAYKANFNMIRVWGGGYYQDDVFYETCDKLGLMVWQDFMFACAMYPGDDTFLENVKNELSFQLPRLSAHPSVVYFNGNNEVDVAWKNWGFQITYLIGPRMQRRMEHDYRKLFQHLAPDLVKKHTFIPYEHTSPLSNWGKAENFNHGTMHYWGVWHGKDPLVDFGLKTGRFNAEYGFQSFPEFSTLRSFSEPKDWDLNSAVMKQHQKSYVGNGMIKKHADPLFGEARNFKEFVYFSQLTQAKAVGIAIVGHRTNFPRCMGTLYWQLNDCWPATTWSSIDYFNNWKALHYEVQRDYEDVAIVERVEKIGEGKYFFLADVDEHFTSKISYEILDLKGKRLLNKEMSIHSDSYWLQEICLECQEDNYRNQNYCVTFRWNDQYGKEHQRTFFHEAASRTRADVKVVQLTLSEIDTLNNTAVLEIKNTQFLASCWISSQRQGVTFSENFEHYLPGTHRITIHFTDMPRREDFEIFWR